jgi:hypothetical protein
MLIIELLFQNKSLIELNLGNNWINHDGIIVILLLFNTTKRGLPPFSTGITTLWQS